MGGQTIHIEWAKSDRKTPKEMRKQSNAQNMSRELRGRYDRAPRIGYDRDRARGMRGRGGFGAPFGGRGMRYNSYSRSPSRDRNRARPSRRRRYAHYALFPYFSTFCLYAKSHI